VSLTSKLLRSLLLAFFCSSAWAEGGKIGFSTGFFAISAKANGKSDSISNPSAFRGSYAKSVLRKYELSVGYTFLLSDFSGSDLGYGIDIGANYFPLTLSSDQNFKNSEASIRSYSNYSPYIGLGFYQRNFQSIKNSYAGFGATLGCEKYYSAEINFKAEARYISMSGSGESEATEVNLLIGIIYKI
jgi:hypothetical protein